MTITTQTQNGVGGASGVAAPTAIGANGEVSQLFTTLLIAQIRNQNPLEPTDPSEFVGQLTQLSQMEALQKLTQQGAAGAAMLESLQVLGLGSQVGSQVSVVAERVTLADEPVQGRMRLPNGAASAAIVLEGAGVRRRIELGAVNAGDATFTIDPRELGLPAGDYSVRAEVDGEDGPAVEIFGELESVRITAADGVVLQVANVGAVSPQYVTGFNGFDRNAH
jgi:flagellar basal-body rod modification protein FlgD